MLGTLTAAILAFPVGFLAAKNVVPNIFAHFAVRRSLDTIRSVDVLIWALIWINVVGLGPFAGVLAIAASDFGAFGKLFSEAIEAADRKPMEGIVSTGGTKLHALRFGLIPQVFPVLASQVLYYFESNTRSATIIGIVGAGGIGLHLAEAIRTLELQQTSFIILMILVAVAVIDFVSSQLRFALIGRRGVKRRGRVPARYALYYAPRPDEGLATAAGQWLGRNPEGGPDSAASRWCRASRRRRLAEITAEPRLYGFHGTLKAPIELADGATERDFLDAVGRFAAELRAVRRSRRWCWPRSRASWRWCRRALPPTLQDLADRCVVEFDEFRQPADEAELARRRGAGLTPRQDELLMRWGYPYVLEQWRFHLTLTARLADEAERSSMAALRQRFGGFTDRPLPVNDLCVFRQPAPGRPFTVLARFRLGGGRRVSTEAWRAA